MKIYKLIKQMGLVLIFVLTACTLPSPQPTPQNTNTPEAQDPLAGTQWSLVTLGSSGAETPIVPDSHVTLQFGEENGVSGNAGCNSFGGSYKVENQKLEFSQVITTLMACTPEEVMQQEREFLNALNNAASFEISNGNLQIKDQAGQFVLNFEPFVADDNPTPVPETAVPSATTEASATAAATNVATLVPTATSDSSSSLEPDYLDDRSTATGLMQSYFNAINRSEYLRAYSYWRDPAGTHGSFEQFQAGYENTHNVTLQFGQIGGDVGAGQMYYSVPMLITEQANAGTSKSYAACYILHLSQPTFQEPPFQGLTIERGKATVIGSADNANNALATACSGPDYPAGNPINPPPVTNTNDISKDNYLDDRSDPVLVLSSLFNAINRHEYARAYGYWDAPSGSANLPTYENFKNGYANTKTVEFLAGVVSADAGAGQRYYSVPVVLSAQLENGTQQTFSGCYFLHMSAASIQATPPFSPLAIRSAKINQVANTSDLASIMPQNCQP